MTGFHEDQQAKIGALKTTKPDADLILQDRLLEFAERGMDRPQTLSLNEISQISYALRMLYLRRR